MVTLIDVRERVRRDLSDFSEERWPDAQLDRHIAHALDELSLAIPQELTATVATTAGSRDLSLAALDGLIEVDTVEFPLAQFPPCYVGFSTWANTLSLHSATAPDGSNAKVYYTAMHTLDGDGTTLPEALVEMLTTGASAYAAQELSSGNTGILALDPAAVERYAAWSRARLTAFRQLLHTYGRKNRLRARTLYVPA
jgi:hypothetical protein